MLERSGQGPRWGMLRKGSDISERLGDLAIVVVQASRELPRERRRTRLERQLRSFKGSVAFRWETAALLLATAGCTRVSVTVHNETDSPLEYEAFEVEDGTERRVASGRLGGGDSENFSFSSNVEDEGGVLIRAELHRMKLERDDCYLTPNQLTESCQFFVFDDAILNEAQAQERQGK